MNLKPNKHAKTPGAGKSGLSRTLLSLVITAVFGAVYFYVALPPLNPQAQEFYGFVTLLCIVYLIICFVYLACMQEFFLNFTDFITIFGIMLYTTISSTLMTVFICSFIKTEGTMASLVAVFSTAVGFLIGAYMPLGMLPTWVQTVCAFIPGTYSCALLRYSFMATPIAELEHYVVDVMQYAGGQELIAELTSSFGYNLEFISVTVEPPYQMLALTVFNIVFLALNIFSGKKLADVLGVGKKKRKKRAQLAAQAASGSDPAADEKPDGQTDETKNE